MNSLSYRPRACRYLGNLTVADCRYKYYLISADQSRANNAVAIDTLIGWIGSASDGWHSDVDHGVGFVIVHFAADGDYLLLSRWADANMLRHRVFALLPEQGPIALADISIIACVWELKLIMAERDAWLEQVLLVDDPVPMAARMTAYLDQAYSGATL